MLPGASLVAEMVKNPSAMQETQEDSLEKGMATPSSILARRSLVGYSPWVCKESDVTEQLSTSIYIYLYLYMLHTLTYVCMLSFLNNKDHPGYMTV